MADKKDDIVLSIRGMSKSFGRNRVLDHINLDVKRGTVMGLMGENGAGKSTMMKGLFGTYQTDEGTIYLDGKEISFSGPKDALENGIAMVHQELNQCLERNVVDNLFLGRYPVNSMGVVDEGRMKKKLIAALLVCAMCASLFTACTSGGDMAFSRASPPLTPSQTEPSSAESSETDTPRAEST